LGAGQLVKLSGSVPHSCYVARIVPISRISSRSPQNIESQRDRLCETCTWRVHHSGQTVLSMVRTREGLCLSCLPITGSACSYGAKVVPNPQMGRKQCKSRSYCLLFALNSAMVLPLSPAWATMQCRRDAQVAGTYTGIWQCQASVCVTRKQRARSRVVLSGELAVPSTRNPLYAGQNSLSEVCFFR